MQLLTQFADLLWHPVMLLAVLATGLMFTLRSAFCQWQALTHGVDLIRGKYDHAGDPGAINHFQALSTALSATVGLGNIAGVALAVSIGGPGAVFWMWMTGLAGMALKTFEVTQAMLYRDLSKPAEPHGGAMWVVSKGFARRWPRYATAGRLLAGAFCLALLVSTATGGNMFQAWNVADITWSYFGVPQVISGLVMAALVAAVVLGGIHRIGTVTGALVPFMCGLYLIAGLAVLALQAGEIPALLALIVRSAFAPAEAQGAFLGGAAGWAFLKGMQRALFSNEAGQGSSPIAHSAARTSEPASEGIVAGLEPFVDTLVVCTITALVILSSGIWNRPVDLTFTTMPEIVESSPGSWSLAPAELRLQVTRKIEPREPVFAVFEAQRDTASGTNLHRVYGTLQQLGDDRFAVQWEAITADVTPRLYADGAWFEYKGATLTARAFDRAIDGLGYWIVPLTAWLFAISTMISWSYYGEQGVVFLWGDRTVMPYRIAYCLLVLLSTTPLIRTEAQLDALSSLGTGIMLVTNIPIMWLFAGESLDAYRDYLQRRGLRRPRR